MIFDVYFNVFLVDVFFYFFLVSDIILFFMVEGVVNDDILCNFIFIINLRIGNLVFNSLLNIDFYFWVYCGWKGLL